MSSILYFILTFYFSPMLHNFSYFQSLSDETDSTSSRSSVTSHSYEVPAPPSDVRAQHNMGFLVICSNSLHFNLFVLISRPYLILCCNTYLIPYFVVFLFGFSLDQLRHLNRMRWVFCCFLFVVFVCFC